MIQLASCYTSQPQLWTAGSGEEESGAEAEWGEGEGSQLWALHQDEGDDPGAGPRETGSCREVTHSFFLLKWDLIPLWCTFCCVSLVKCSVFRDERTQQQFRDDVVNRVQTELMQEHTSHIEQLTSQHQQHLQQLEYCTTPSPLNNMTGNFIITFIKHAEADFY